MSAVEMKHPDSNQKIKVSEDVVSTYADCGWEPTTKKADASEKP